MRRDEHDAANVAVASMAAGMVPTQFRLGEIHVPPAAGFQVAISVGVVRGAEPRSVYEPGVSVVVALLSGGMRDSVRAPDSPVVRHCRRRRNPSRRGGESGAIVRITRRPRLWGNRSAHRRSVTVGDPAARR